LDWQTLLNRERLGKPLHSPQELGRSPFHKDHDRIIFSGAFRRLGRKTQVHPVSSNDHIHTRLTHSLEVSCVGRSLGMRVGETLRSALPDWCDPAIWAWSCNRPAWPMTSATRRSATPVKTPFALVPASRRARLAGRHERSRAR
jgi:hypothetical protein